MRCVKYLLRGLSKLSDLNLDGFLLYRVTNLINVDCAFVCPWMEHCEELIIIDVLNTILSSNGIWPLLLVSKYEVYPFREVLGYVFAFQCLSVLYYEVFWT